MPATMIRQLPSLRLSTLIETPDGYKQRWGWDDPDPKFAAQDLSFSTAMPGGFERMSCTLERDPRRSYPDLSPLSTCTVMGPGGQVAWQGRMEKLPDTGGFESQVTPECVGWQAHLEDDAGVREIYVDRELSRWQGASAERKLALLRLNIDLEDGFVGSSGSGLPAYVTQLVGAWARVRASDGVYNSQGIPIGLVKYVWQLAQEGKIGSDPTSDTNWTWTVYICENGLFVEGLDSSGNLRAAGPTGSGTLDATTAKQFFAMVELAFDTAAGGAGETYPVSWPTLAVYGQHGLPLSGGLGLDEAPGLLASQIIGHAVSKWAPLLKRVIVPSGFIIPQAAFLEPTTVSEVVKQMSRFELLDWAVWENLTFYLNPRGERGRAWKARIGPAQLQETGRQVSRLWNGVIVSYQNVAGETITVGPPGSGMAVESDLLIDNDPENPLNQRGLKKYAPLKMGTSTTAGAEQIGKRFLEEALALDTSGQATLTGYVEDSKGIIWPSWMVRGGDTLSFVDAADPSPRRVISTSYEDNTKANSIQLDQPPEGLQAVLERLSVVLVPLGLS